MVANNHHDNPMQIGVESVIQTDWHGRPAGTNPYPPPVPQHEIPPRVLRHFPIGVGEHENDPGEVINHYQPGVYGNHANDEEDEDDEDPEEDPEEGLDEEVHNADYDAAVEYNNWMVDQQFIIVDEDPPGYHDDDIVP